MVYKAGNIIKPPKRSEDQNTFVYRLVYNYQCTKKSYSPKHLFNHMQILSPLKMKNYS